jgi:hypothetical protein
MKIIFPPKIPRPLNEYLKWENRYSNFWIKYRSMSAQ